MQTALDVLLAIVALYPVLTAALWIAGGLMFRLWDERPSDPLPETERDWPGVSVLIPAYNEAAVIATSVRAALKSDYPRFEVLVLDDGSSDETEAAAIEAGAGDRRLRVLRDPVNRGKAEQLNLGFARARHELVMVTDADTHMHPRAIRFLVARIESSPVLAAVAGAPHVTNRDGVLCAMQVLEAAAIIGLVRRTQSLTGRVGIVAGVLGLFRRDRVLAVGGYDGRMATEDIDLTWRLLIAGWQTAYEPRALVGMQVPSSLHALWAQRKRWARGQGEVLHAHLRDVCRWRNHRMWLLGLESLASLIWVACLLCSLVLSVLNVLFGQHLGFFGVGLGWGVAISTVAVVQLTVAVVLSYPYDHWDVRAMVLGPLYPILFWLISASAAINQQITALIRGPRDQRVVWDIPREPLDSTSP
ncbi:glycosyltransferase [Solirubrobacter ginsenosidimutans]|uniref:Glycosyltransferase n=1 Tax=Solirubrobacter ginsenosidimutans TaxID=490573 RepID=A0A9X3MX90_9ACTN|nr:glycosyltransferase family 2 protein [Solirubrobacter ginsenosidimutans]MDA0164202.1 glycosyltransferase [Solirubrobacter ginsenosidimutans]